MVKGKLIRNEYGDPVLIVPDQGTISINQIINSLIGKQISYHFEVLRGEGDTVTINQIKFEKDA